MKGNVLVIIVILTAVAVIAFNRLQAVMDRFAKSKGEILQSFYHDFSHIKLENIPWVSVLCGSCVLYICYYLYYKLFTPLDLVKDLSDVGYATNSGSEGRSKREVANHVRRLRKIGDIPPVYPNGWFALMEAHRLKKGEIEHVVALGENFAVFRDENGSAHAVDAYCSHMGANLAVGGRVIGDCIECPFHGWRFRGDDGKCTHIPYCEKVPDRAKVKSWPVLERSGHIFVWYHAEGVEPTWLPPEIDEVESGHWVYKGRNQYFVNTHIQDIPENGADQMHLAQVHGPCILSGVDLRYMYSKLWEFAKHNWQAEWQPLPEPNTHIACLELGHKLSILDRKLPGLEMRVNARQIGPGLVYLEFQAACFYGVYIQTLTPIEPLVQKLTHTLFASRWMPMPVASAFLLGEAYQVERDIMIWNNKKFENKPLLVKSRADERIARYRRWFSQFYSENSPRLSLHKEGLDW